MREFLLSNYPQQTTILDVAGGKGDLSWLLSNFDSRKTLVLDPRPRTNHASLERSLSYLLCHPVEAEARSLPGPHHQPLARLARAAPEVPLSPPHLSLKLDEKFVRAVDSREAWMEYWSEERPRGNVSALEAFRWMGEVDLVVGFHPDQATEACLDLARRLGVPFAVCPCCVFPSEFPWRQVDDGDGRKKRVRTHAQLIEYLKKKCEGVREATLQFDKTGGKNVVLYTLPGDDISWSEDR